MIFAVPKSVLFAAGLESGRERGELSGEIFELRIVAYLLAVSRRSVWAII